MSEGRFSALGEPLYRRYWLGSLGSVGATQLVLMAQAWLVFDLQGPVKIAERQIEHHGLAGRVQRPRDGLCDTL